MEILRLNLKRKWWEQIKVGDKDYELRLCTPYWEKRLLNRDYDEIHLCLGYPKKCDDSRIIKRLWNGYSIEEECHEEFGDNQVRFFMIDVSNEI